MRNPGFFFLAGFAKCGSTTLHRLLRRHPEIYMYAGKDYTSLIDDQYRHGKLMESFRYAPGGLLKGYTSVRICDFQNSHRAVKRIDHYFPDRKIIFIIRDPVSRIESAYRNHHDFLPHLASAQRFNLDDALKQFVDVLQQSRYWRCISRFRKYFSDEHIHVLLLEDFHRQQDVEMNRICRFLGVSEMADWGSPKHDNDGQEKYRDTQEMFELRNHIYFPEIGESLGKLKNEIQNQFLPHLGLRKAFGRDSIHWSDTAKRMVYDYLEDDPHRMLDHLQRPMDIWPRYKALWHELEMEK